jgi:hypothetical protein
MYDVGVMSFILLLLLQRSLLPGGIILQGVLLLQFIQNGMKFEHHRPWAWGPIGTAARHRPMGHIRPSMEVFHGPS